MSENDKSKIYSPWVAAVAALAMIGIAVQIIMTVEQMEIFQYIDGYPLYRLAMFRVIAIIVPVIILVTVLAGKYTASLAALAGYYVLYALINLSGLLFGQMPTFSMMLYLVIHLVTAVVLILVLAGQVKAMAGLVCCAVLQAMWVIFYLFNNISNMRVLSLIGTASSAALVLCLLCLMKDKLDKAGSSGEGLIQNLVYDQNRLIELEVKDLAVCILLSIITCGIYNLFWLVSIVRNVHRLHGSEESVVPEVMLMIFIPFYISFWMYKNGHQMYEDSQRCHGNLDDNGIMYMILTLLGFRLIPYALIQYDLNRFAVRPVSDTTIDQFS